MGAVVFTVMSALAQMELNINRERIGNFVIKWRAAGKNLGGRRIKFTNSQIRGAAHLLEQNESAAQMAKDWGMSRATLYRRIRALEQRSSGGPKRSRNVVRER